MSDLRRGGGPRRIGLPTGITGGIVFAVAAALISGLAIYVNAFAVKQVPDAAVFTTLKNGVAALVLGSAALALGGVGQARGLSPKSWRTAIVVGVIGGSIPFILFFSGLAQASAPSAAFIQKTLFIWVALLAVPVLGERLGPAPIAALAVLLVGQALVLPPAGIVWGTGETLILLATLFWAVETILVARLVQTTVPVSLMAALRMGIGLIVLVGYLVVSGKLGVVSGLGLDAWAWIVVTGLVLSAYVGTWFSALSRAPATIVTSVLVLGAVVTGLLTSVTKGAVPSPAVVGGYLLIIAAAGALAWFAVRTGRRLGTGTDTSLADARAA